MVYYNAVECFSLHYDAAAEEPVGHVDGAIGADRSNTANKTPYVSSFNTLTPDLSRSGLNYTAHSCGLHLTSIISLNMGEAKWTALSIQQQRKIWNAIDSGQRSNDRHHKIR